MWIGGPSELRVNWSWRRGWRRNPDRASTGRNVSLRSLLSFQASSSEWSRTPVMTSQEAPSMPNLTWRKLAGIAQIGEQPIRFCKLAVEVSTKTLKTGLVALAGEPEELNSRTPRTRTPEPPNF